MSSMVEEEAVDVRIIMSDSHDVGKECTTCTHLRVSAFSLVMEKSLSVGAH